MRHAIVKDDIVINLVEWNGSDRWTPPAGTKAYACPDDVPVSIGWRWNNGNPINPEPPSQKLPPTIDMSDCCNHSMAVQAVLHAAAMMNGKSWDEAQKAFTEAWKKLSNG